ncbi:MULTISPECIES: hypothetical protein [Nonomuraea]|uniref:hypothetical protein n=1 Tax=Nonomuraea TaxID=83681 RepID=UPI001C5E924B|nr:hypothetical protein [Nonomuraea ceibae]
MTNDLTEARDRLVPPRRLHQVAALLNMPNLDETTPQDGVPPSRQQATLYAGIADWARLSAMAADQLDESGAPEIADEFVYLVEYTDQHAKGWHPAPSEHSDGITFAERAEVVARTVMGRYITHLADHRDDYELWLVDSLSLRVSVWNARTANEARSRDRRLAYSYSGHTFQELQIPPNAVEIRTPVQIHRFMTHYITCCSEPEHGEIYPGNWAALPTDALYSYLRYGPLSPGSAG